MKKIFKIMAPLLVVALLFFGCAGMGRQDDTVYKLVVLHTNDTHGHPLKFYYYPAPDVGGIPARDTLAKEVRSEYEHVLVLDAGDMNTGMPESNFFNAEPDIIGYNAVGYDALVLGNHEFDHPLDILKEQMGWANFPFISANVKTADGKDLVTPYIIKDYGKFKVAIFGLTTKETAIIGNPENIKGLVFEDEVEVAKKLVPKLKKKADVVIALVHLGIYGDDTRGSRRLAANVDGIDLIVDGHTHTLLQEPLYVNNTPIVTAKDWGLYLGKGVLSIQGGKVIGLEWEAIPVNLKTRVKNDDGTTSYPYVDREIKEDPVVLALLEPFKAKVDQILSEKIGFATDTFLNADVRKQETALGDMVADSMAWYMSNLDVDFAVQNGGGIREDLPQGDITKKLIYSILPFDNSVVVMSLKGSDVKAMFDFLPVRKSSGAFAQVSQGVHYTLNLADKKTTDITINGKPLDPEKVYKIATNSYLAAGGDGYGMFKNAVDLYDSSMMQRDVFIEYVQFLGGTISPSTQGRITVVE